MMSVYDLSGNALNTIYNKDGTPLSDAYDIDGNPVFNGENQIAVMAFNVGCFYSEWHPAPVETGTVFYQRHKNIFDKYSLDFCAMSEWYNQIGTVAASVLMNEEFADFEPNYTPYSSPNAALTSAFSGTPSNTTLVQFTNQGSETRYYQKSYITLCGKTICCILTHLDLQSAARTAQFLELMTAVQNEEYFIIAGDFNFQIQTVGDSEYNKCVKVAIDNGYNSAQNANSMLMTHYDGETVGTSAHAYALDNIITSANITINNVVRDETKLTDGLCEEYNIIIDHLPLIAYCTIN